MNTVSCIHLSYAKLRVLVPFLRSASYPIVIAIMSMTNGLLVRVQEGSVTDTSFSEGVSTLQAEVLAQLEGNEALMSTIIHNCFAVCARHAETDSRLQQVEKHNPKNLKQTGLQETNQGEKESKSTETERNKQKKAN